MWDLSSLTRDGTCTPSMKAWSINFWLTRDVPVLLFIVHQYSNSKCVKQSVIFCNPNCCLQECELMRLDNRIVKELF